MKLKTELKDSILNDYYIKIKQNLFKKISPYMHTRAYTGEHDICFAEPEFSGKYIDICAAYYRLDEDEQALEAAKTVAYAAVKAQRDDGYLGMYTAGNEFEGFSVWNEAFTLFGMLSYYKVAADKNILFAAEKCMNYLINEFDVRDILDAENMGTENLIIILPAAILFEITRDEKYSSFIERIKCRLKESNLNLIEPSDILQLRSRKGIEILVAYLGLVRFARMVGDGEIISGAKCYWEQVQKTQIRNTGGATTFELWVKDGAEAAFLPDDVKPNENCVAVGWIELCMELFYITRDKKYLDAAEKTLFNHLLGAVSKNYDDFSYYQSNFGRKIQGTSQNMYSCCRYRGLTLFAHMKELLYYDDGCDVIPMIYTASEFENENVKIIQNTDYPKSGKIEFLVYPRNAAEISLKLRIPSWCRNASAFADGKKIPKKNDFFVFTGIGREMHIHVELDMAPEFKISEIFGTNFASITYGPILMASDSSYGKLCKEIVFKKDETDFIVDTNCAEAIAKIMSGDYVLVDYASAGRRNPSEDEFSVWIKEYTKTRL